MPLPEALKQLLKPLNYYLIRLKETGDIKSLMFNNMHVASDNCPEPAITSSPVNISDNTFTELLAELGTGEKDHPSCMMEDEDTELPQALLDSFNPVKEAGSEITGPQVQPDILIKKLQIAEKQINLKLDESLIESLT